MVYLFGPNGFESDIPEDEMSLFFTFCSPVRSIFIRRYYYQINTKGFFFPALKFRARKGPKARRSEERSALEYIRIRLLSSDLLAFGPLRARNFSAGKKKPLLERRYYYQINTKGFFFPALKFRARKGPKARRSEVWPLGLCGPEILVREKKNL
jgi:hypothetical protein